MKKNLVLIGIVVLLAVIPLFIQNGAEFGGSDDQAESVIAEMNPNYEPWFSSFWEPPSGEIESLLFCLQAALGAGFIGYFVGYYKGKKNRGERKFNA
ncbi:cobalt/nickel transport protein [Desulfotomaculum arcticum]|uniref:Cobalt transport protein CbiN n=1 Tax=Desulfotruncus arcticus DSM 17038 TaxID=1121424 RepID=A0A1I2N9R4_9FIRM|nr:energy-coupling factor ABC transporter substrate-binding protein [Desulfotruncus arcticus]SFF98101.1 cobalt/nickel transport protein [Desulfotomaculum arcticum] [Desulfotruncus arcticus DSM 17038]